MQITLDPETEQRIQRELDRGTFHEPAEVIAHALLLLEAQAEDDWLFQNREEINHALDISFAQAEAGQSYSPEEARQLLAERRAAHNG